MTKVFFSVSMSLDGFVAPAGMDMEHAFDPSYLDWGQQWGRLHAWVSKQQFFINNLKLEGEGETGPDNQLLTNIFERTGVSIMGKRMFDAGEMFWPEEAPFHSPVFVLTSQVRSPWERPGGTTFHFVNDGIVSALEQARAVANGRDIRIAGGANVIQQYLNAGLVDEFHIGLSPVLFGDGVRLFDNIDHTKIALVLEEAIHSPDVTHLNYTVKKLA